ncbi:MAG: MarR family transcriptional regulator [Candidatus Hodarchaeota archaeon]
MSLAKDKDNQAVAKLEEEISNFFEDFLYNWGGSPLLGRIYALCVLSPPKIPVIQKDLVDIFNVNSSTVSRNLRELEKWRLLVKRREPGSREWQYYIEGTSFLELLTHQFEVIAVNLRERTDGILRIQNRWGSTLMKTSKKTKKSSHALKELQRLAEWIKIVEERLSDFIQRLNAKYLEFERNFG